MKIVFNKNDYKSYKDFYVDVLKKLNSKRFTDWQDETNLGYNGNLLGEFLWYCSEDSNDYLFVNFNIKKKIIMNLNNGILYFFTLKILF